MRLSTDAQLGLATVGVLAVFAACGGGGNSSTVPPGPIQSAAPGPIQSAALASVSGTLMDDASQPISGATVSLAPYQTPPPSGAPEPTMAPAVATTTTNGSGGYSINGIAPGTYLLSVVPQDASAVFQAPPASYPTPDAANSGMGAYTATHATLHRKVTLTSGSNALGTDQILRLTDNEVLCAQVFEQSRRGAGVSTLAIDSAAQLAVRTAVDYIAAHGVQDPVNPYTGVGSMQAGYYASGGACPSIADPLVPSLESTSFAYAGISVTNPNAGGPYDGIQPIQYP